VNQGIQHGRLPIGDYIRMTSRHVLTVNQVLEIMLRWLENEDWEKAFMDVIPKRKFPEMQDSEGVAEAKSLEGDESEIVTEIYDDAEISVPIPGKNDSNSG